MKKVIIIIILLLPVLVSAQLEIDYPSLPGGEDITGETTFAEYLRYFYNISFMIAGLIAFLSLIAAGWLYITSVGNPAKISEAKDRILSALLGIGILVLSYLLLVFINPDLTTFVLPGLEEPPETEEIAVRRTAAKSDVLGTVKEIGYMGGLAMEGVGETGEDMLTSSLACLCLFAKSLCLCTGGSESDACEPQTCYTGSDSDGHPCWDYPSIKDNQELIAFWTDELIYYQNRALGFDFLRDGVIFDPEALEVDLRRIILERIGGLDFDRLREAAVDEAISNVLGGEAERVYKELVNTVIPKEEYFEALIATQTDPEVINDLLERSSRVTREHELIIDLIERLIEFAVLAEAIKGPVEQIAQLPEECALRVQEECQPECIEIEGSQCHDTFLGCRSWCSGLNPCPIIETAFAQGQIALIQLMAEDVTEDIMNIVDEIRELRTL